MDNPADTRFFTQLGKDISDIKEKTASIETQVSNIDEVVDKHNGHIDKLRMHCAGRGVEIDAQFNKVASMLNLLTKNVNTINKSVAQQHDTVNLLKTRIDDIEEDMDKEVEVKKEQKKLVDKYKFWFVTMVLSSVFALLLTGLINLMSR